MRTHNIPFSIEKENLLKLSQICSYGFFSKGLKKKVRNSPGKRAIRVRATEVLLSSQYLTLIS